jgi:hypothetical protein
LTFFPLWALQRLRRGREPLSPTAVADKDHRESP